MHNFYAILGIEKNASAEEIKKAYYRLAHQYHPDKNLDNPEAGDHFKRIQQAYQILSNPQTRRQYDYLGMPFGNHPGDDFMQQTINVVGELLQQFWPSHASDKQPPHKLVYATANIDFCTALYGGTCKVEVKAAQTCNACAGLGTMPSNPPKACPTCHSTGNIRVRRGMFVFKKTCPKCMGKKELRGPTCQACQGQGLCESMHVVSVDIAAGIAHNTVLNKPINQICTLHATIKTTEHPIYKRVGTNLFCDMPISLMEATLGNSKNLPSPRSGNICLKIPPGTQSGETLRLPHAAQSQGHLYVQIMIETPQQLGPQEQVLISNLKLLETAQHHPKKAAFQALLDTTDRP